MHSNILSVHGRFLLCAGLISYSAAEAEAIRPLGPPPDWDPVTTIDGADVIIVATARTEMISPSVQNGAPIGFFYTLTVSDSIAGMLKKGESVSFFQPASSMEDSQWLVDEEFIVFARQLSAKEIAELAGKTSDPLPEKAWTFSTAGHSWMSYLPLRVRAGALPSRLRHILENEGIGTTRDYLVAYIHNLARLRKEPATESSSSTDKYTKQLRAIAPRKR